MLSFFFRITMCFKILKTKWKKKKRKTHTHIHFSMFLYRMRNVPHIYFTHTNWISIYIFLFLFSVFQITFACLAVRLCLTVMTSDLIHVFFFLSLRNFFFFLLRLLAVPSHFHSQCVYLDSVCLLIYSTNACMRREESNVLCQYSTFWHVRLASILSRTTITMSIHTANSQPALCVVCTIHLKPISTLFIHLIQRWFFL